MYPLEDVTRMLVRNVLSMNVCVNKAVSEKSTQSELQEDGSRTR